MAEVEVPEALRRAAAERDWPEDLIERAAALAVPTALLDQFFFSDSRRESIERQLGWWERLTTGPLRAREATVADNEALADLWANSPIEIGDWEITTERWPNAFAQFRLQENVTLTVLAEHAKLIACVSWSRRNVFVQGRRMSVTYGQALRTRRDYRRQGYGDIVRRIPWGANCARVQQQQYDIMRSQNFAVVNWWTKYDEHFFDETPKQEGDVPGVPVTVTQVPARAGAVDPAIRVARRDDVPRCVELINRTHEGLDFFRPYTHDFLENVLDEGFWGERPFWWRSVYAWSDYFVLEEGGRIVACAGLWDRGRDMRERWRRKDAAEGDPEKVVTDTCLLDFGFEAGAEDAMERLLLHLLGRTHELGREFLLAPLDFQPELAKRVESYEPVPETRALRWGTKDPSVERPYTDLRYW